jgi:endonuclease/exonuclease/phosphatase (EEP) superfamily protein YafD
VSEPPRPSSAGRRPGGGTGGRAAYRAAGGAPRRPRPPPRVRYLRLAAWACLLVGLALTASWWVSRDFWLADVANLFRPAVLLFAVLVLGLAIGGRAVGLIGLSLLLAGANLYLLLQPTLAIPAAQASGARRAAVSVASFDVVSDESLPDFTSWVKDKKTRPDIVALQNLTNPWTNRIAQITDVYPFSASALHHQAGVKEDVLSRYPILDASVYRPAGGRTAVHATVLVDGEPVQVFVIDPNKATGQARWAERNQYLGLVSQWVAGQAAGQPALLLGDWNITPWSPFYADVFESSGLRRGDAGVLPPATHTLARLPIPLLGLNDDHMAVSRRIPVEGCQPGPDLGSDHLPLVCQIHVR